MSATGSGQRGPAERTRPSNRTIGGIVLAVLLVVWILVNQSSVEVSFVFGSVEMPLWVALAIAAVLGAAVGFVLGRRRYKA